MEEKCEECQEENEKLFDAIYDNKIMKLCERCIKANRAIVIKKPAPIEEEKRKTVREVLAAMSGIDIKELPIKKPVSAITLEDLRDRYKAIKEKGKMQEKVITGKNQEPVQVLDEEEFVEHLEQKEAIKTIKTDEPIDFSLEATKKIKVMDLVKLKKTEPAKT